MGTFTKISANIIDFLLKFLRITNLSDTTMHIHYSICEHLCVSQIVCLAIFKHQPAGHKFPYRASHDTIVIDILQERLLFLAVRQQHCVQPIIGASVVRGKYIYTSIDSTNFNLLTAD